MNQFLSTVKDSLKDQSALLLRPLGMNLLRAAQSETLLADYRIYNNEAQTLTLDRVADVLDPTKVLFEPKTITTASARVWQYPSAGQRTSLLRNGSLRFGTSVLNPDFGNSTLLKDVLKFNRREPLQTDTLIAPWSHYWGGYYDYLIFVAAKINRIKTVLSVADFADAVISYPLLNTAFERDLLALLDCMPDSVVDSRTTDVRFGRCVLGNSGNWFYPNVADLLGLKQRIAASAPVAKGTPKRLYISRSGRRRVINEDTLIRMLTSYGFTVVEDRPRTVSEQYQLYNNASFIIGPHGASFANTLWCTPGTQLFELFPHDYMPEYFRYMAQVLGLRYHAYCQGDGSGATSHYSNMYKDVPVSVDDLERRLNRIFEIDSVR